MTANDKIRDRCRKYVLGRLTPAEMQRFERDLADCVEYPNPLHGQPGLRFEAPTLTLLDWLDAIEFELVEAMFTGKLPAEERLALSAYGEQGDNDRRDRIRDHFEQVRGEGSTG